MTVGLGVLGLSPAAFWAMTPREFGFALARFMPRRREPMGRRALDDLMQRFPDEG